jgi:hypothetical protein
MEKYFELLDKLRGCYKKVHYDDYWNLSDEEKETICPRERQEVRKYVNSDAFSNAALVKEHLAHLEGKS